MIPQGVNISLVIDTGMELVSRVAWRDRVHRSADRSNSWHVTWKLAVTAIAEQ